MRAERLGRADEGRGEDPRGVGADREDWKEEGSEP